jgi:hypothetical protein
MAAATVLLVLAPAGAVPGATQVAPMRVAASWGGQPAVVPQAVSCPAVGRCTAILGYGAPASAPARSAVESEQGAPGRWSAPTDLPVPAGTAPSLRVRGYEAVACPTTAACTAVGTTTKGADVVPMVATGAAATWTLVTGVPLPPGTTNATMDAVWCAAPSTCVVAGSASPTPLGASHAFVDTEVGGTWRPSAVIPDPRGPTGARSVLVVPAGLACTAVASCAVVGRFSIANGAQYGFAAVLRSGAWAVRTFAPGRTVLDALNAVACPTATTCVAVGVVHPSTGGGDAPYAVTYQSGRWGDGTILRWQYAAPSTDGAALAAVACTSSTRCLAVGALERPVGTHVPPPFALLASAYTDTAGRWSAPGLVTAPPWLGSASTGADLQGVACPGTTGCVAVGATAPRSAATTGARFPFSAAVAPSSPGTAPSAPTALRASSTGKVMDVSWGAPAQLGGSPIATFTVVARSPGEPAVSCAAPGLGCRLAEVAAGHRYTVDVTARNTAGRAGPTARLVTTAR